jgi:hypothetical protein
LSLQHLLAIDDATVQLTELDRNRQVAITQQESAAYVVSINGSILQVLMEKEKSEKVKKEEIAEYESSFESLSESSPKVHSKNPNNQNRKTVDSIIESAVSSLEKKSKKPNEDKKDAKDFALKLV